MTAYRVWCLDLGQTQEDGKNVLATNPKEAAQDWARWNDQSSAEYNVVGGAIYKVAVLGTSSLPPAIYEVSGEALPTYYAKKVE